MDDTAPGEAHRLTRRDWSIVLVGLATVALPDVMPVMVGALQAQFGFGPAEAGYVISINMAGILGGTTAYPLLARRIADRTLLYAGLIALIAGNLATIPLHDRTALFAVRAISGLGEGVGCAIAYTLMAKAAEPGRLIAFYAAGQSILAAAGMAALTLLIARLGPSTFYACLSLLTTPALLIVPYVTSDSGPRRHTPLSVRSVLPVWAMLQLVAIFLFYTGMGMVWTFMQRIADDRHIGVAFTASTLSAAALFGFAGSMSVATAAYRLPVMTALALTGGGVLACTLSLSAADARLFFVGAALLKFTWGFAAPFLFRILAETDPTGRTGGLTLLGTASALAISPAVGGVLLEARGLLALLLALMLATIGGLTVAAFVSRRGRPSTTLYAEPVR